MPNRKWTCRPEVDKKTGCWIEMMKGGCLCPMTPKVFGFQDKFLASGHIITKQLKESSDSYLWLTRKNFTCDMNKGKWSYHPNWNFGVKNFRITNFRLNNIFSTIFYGFDGFTARIFDILWFLLKCWEMLWFHSNKAFSKYTDEYRANGQYDSSHMTHGMTHSYKI